MNTAREEIFIGIDVGTTGTKALAVDCRGRVVGQGYREYALRTLPGKRIEQDADDWWNAVVCTVREAAAAAGADRVVSIGLSTQGASMLAVDSGGNPICPAISWMDKRAVREAEEFADKIGEENIYRKTGWRPSPSYDAAKILWLREHDPDLFVNAAGFVSTQGYINSRLCGRCVEDPTNASIRQLFNINTGRYDPEILDYLGIGEDRLPEIAASCGEVGKLTRETAKMFGFGENVRVYNGAHDQYCAAIGSGIGDDGRLLLATGTTWVMFGVTGQPMYTPSRIAPGIFPGGGRYGAMASMVSAGSALKWWKNIIGGSYAEIDAEAEKRRGTAADLLFYPYVAGSGMLRGAPLQSMAQGMTIAHDKYDIALSIMEGVAFEVRFMLGEFTRCGMVANQVVMTGGAARSKLWSEITANVIGRDIIQTEQSEAAALGAAMIAAVGSGYYKSLGDASDKMVSVRRFEVQNDDRAFYNEKYAKYAERFKNDRTS